VRWKVASKEEKEGASNDGAGVNDAYIKKKKRRLRVIGKPFHL